MKPFKAANIIWSLKNTMQMHEHRTKTRNIYIYKAGISMYATLLSSIWELAFKIKVNIIYAHAANRPRSIYC